MQRRDPFSPVADREWPAAARLTAGCALLFCGTTVAVDRCAGSLDPLRAILWIALSCALGAVLLPPRVTAAPGRLAVRTLLRRYVVHTAALTAVRQYPGVSAHLVLQDLHGHRLELDPRVLAANPALRHELHAGAHLSAARGTLRQGAQLLDRLGERSDAWPAETDRGARR
ncbi:hypothetical protein [Streptomyces sp. NPDC003717]|uniref:hypothetical protein n=1 Tax=Streptomyces sp. NPDC003717 TaxID=3154276 RepID=UPI0033B25885